MAASKTLTSIAAAYALAASSTNNFIGIDLTAKDGATVLVSVTNSATAPTSGLLVTIQASGDNITWYYYQSQTAGLAASGVYQMSFDLPASIMYFRVAVSGCNQATTVSAAALIVNNF